MPRIIRAPHVGFHGQVLGEVGGNEDALSQYLESGDFRLPNYADISKVMPLFFRVIYPTSDLA